MRDEIKPLVTDAIRFWEKMRVPFNLVLAAVAIGATYYVLGSMGAAWRYLGNNVLLIFIMTVLANICYCAAYPVDTLVQLSDFQDGWRKGRWMLWLIGTLFAAALTLAAVVGIPQLLA
jgi:hypothetical protein